MPKAIEIYKMMSEERARYVKKSKMLTPTQQREIIDRIFEAIADQLLDGYIMKFPFNLGELRLCTLHNYTFNPYSHGAVDWAETRRTGVRQNHNKVIKDIYFPKWRCGKNKYVRHYNYTSNDDMRNRIRRRVESGVKPFAYDLRIPYKSSQKKTV